MSKVKSVYQAPITIEGSYTLKGIKENGKIYTARVMEKLSKPMNYEQMQEFDFRAREAGNPRLISVSMFFQLAKSGIQTKDNGFLNFLNNGLKKWPNFFSAVNYSANEKDKIIHYEGTPDEYFFNGTFVGPDNLIENTEDKKTLVSLTGIKDISFLNKISNSLNSTNAYLWRVNSKPINQDKKRVVGLVADSDWLYLSACGDLGSQNSCFRVELEEQVNK